MPEAEATFWGQAIIIRMKGRQTILGMLYVVYGVLRVCSTQCMLCSVYACTRCQLMIMPWGDTE